MQTVIPVFIGHDQRAPILLHVATHSIMRRASHPVSITPLGLNMLEQSGVLKRELLPNQSTEFAISRFLTPYLAEYEGWAIFIDNDVVLLDDIKKLWDLRDDRYAVMCVQHDHKPGNTDKFLGEQQTTYEKKNWSSVMLMNCAKCTALTPEYVSKASGLELHRFHWLKSDDLIGALPPEWNHLVETSEGNLEDQKILHYTDGGPYYEAYEECKWASTWLDEKESLMTTAETTLLNFHKPEPVA